MQKRNAGIVPQREAAANGENRRPRAPHCRPAASVKKWVVANSQNSKDLELAKRARMRQFCRSHERTANHRIGARTGGPAAALGAGACAGCGWACWSGRCVSCFWRSALTICCRCRCGRCWSAALVPLPVHAGGSDHRRLAQAGLARSRPLGGWPAASEGAAQHGAGGRRRTGRRRRGATWWSPMPPSMPRNWTRAGWCPSTCPGRTRWALVVLALGAGLGFVPEYRSKSFLQKKADAADHQGGRPATRRFDAPQPGEAAAGP